MTEYNRNEAIRHITSYVYGPETGERNQEFFHEIETTVRGYSDVLLAHLMNAPYGNPFSALDRVEILIADGEKNAGVSEVLYFMGLVQAPRDSFIINAVQGLRITPSLPQYEDYSTADELTRKQCLALVNVTVTIMETRYDDNGLSPLIHMGMGTRFATAINSGDLLRLILERPDDHARITSIIRDRKTTNAGIITNVLNADVQALASGSL